jgi:hypothetical protein
MKKYFLMFIAMIFIAVAFTGCSSGKSGTVEEGGILSINDIQADPEAFNGIITITGIVSRIVGPNPETFMLVDTHEAKSCKSTNCARFYQPVQYEGSLPKEWDEVNVTGSFAQGGKLFQASNIEVIKHLTF